MRKSWSIWMVVCLLFAWAQSADAAQLRFGYPARVPAGRAIPLPIEIVDDAGQVDRNYWSRTVAWELRQTDSEVVVDSGQVVLTNGRGCGVLPPLALGAYSIHFASPDFAELVDHFEVVPGEYQTVSGVLSGADLHWGVDARWIRVTGEIEIPAESELVIEPGTFVLMEDAAGWVVRGGVKAMGTPAAPIVVDALEQSMPWAQIYHMSNSRGAYRNFWIRGGGDVPKIFHAAGSAFYLVNSDIVFDQCVFFELAGKGMDGNYARVQVLDTLFQQCASAGELRRGTCHFRGCHFLDTWPASHDADYDGLYLVGPAEQRVTSCVFARCSDDGLDTFTSSVLVRDTVFYDIADKALSINTGVTLINCLVFRNRLGVVQKGSKGELPRKNPTLAAMHCTIAGCDIGYDLRNQNYDGMEIETVEEIINSIIWDCTQPIVNSYRAQNLYIRNSAFPAGTYKMTEGPGNIQSDPLLTPDETFRLEPDSPCVGAGLGGQDMGWLGFGRGVGDSVWGVY